MHDARSAADLAIPSPLAARTQVWLALLYAATLFTSAALLFWVQPMFAKMVLPLFGGASSVWTTAAMFFQLALLAGYIYAHLLTRLPSIRAQSILHISLLAACFAALPAAADEQLASRAQDSPLLALLTTLALGLGLPFFALAATAPLLQRWFATTRHAQAQDPYFLYSASNLGSLAALIAYPAAIETLLGLRQQSEAWTLGFGVLAGLIAFAAFQAARNGHGEVARSASAATSASRVAWPDRAWWTALAFAPSSLLLGVTQHITNEIAAIPLLWVVPLALYTLTYVNAFARRPPFRHAWSLGLQPPLIMLLALVWVLNIYLVVFVLHLLAFFVTALVCHGELARRRPSATHLTDFYLCIAAGGALGGVFNAVAAPELFNDLIEYPLVIGIACMLRGGPVTVSRRQHAALLWPVLLAVLTGVLILAGYRPLARGAIAVVMYLQVVGIAMYLCHRHPPAFGLAVLVVLLGGSLVHNVDDVLVRHRSFFGVHTVLHDEARKFHVLMHGVTVHGAQYRAPDKWREQTTYYHRDGRLGQMFSALGAHSRFQRVASVGLGVGTVACYRRTDEDWTFYELDPVVAHLAKDTRYFRFLSECAPKAPIVIGDGRLSLRAAPDAHFDLIVVDTFGSDAIPVHMITREALSLYLSKLRPGGVVMFHITNQYVDLVPVLADLAAAAGRAGLMPGSRLSLPPEDRLGQMESNWIAIARDPRDLAALQTEEGWVVLPPRSSARLWTDDYSNVLGALKWKCREGSPCT
jgi:spermidine synthase